MPLLPCPRITSGVTVVQARNASILISPDAAAGLPNRFNVVAVDLRDRTVQVLGREVTAGQASQIAYQLRDQQDAG